MYSSNEELYSYTPEIPQQQNMKNGMFGSQQNNFNNYLTLNNNRLIILFPKVI